MSDALILTVIFICSMFDAMRDGFRLDRHGINDVVNTSNKTFDFFVWVAEKVYDLDSATLQWKLNRAWHIIKWITFYPPYIVIVCYLLPYILWLPAAFLAWLGWRIGIKMSGRAWVTMWFKS